MKVVLNRSYGGFDLSPEAIRLYARYAGKPVYFYEHIKYLRRDHYDEWRKISDTEKLDRNTTYLISVYDEGVSFRKIPKNFDYFDEHCIERTDENLIKVVEELGQKSFGMHSYLEVFDLPDDAFIDTHIESDDGIETIHKNHEYWPKEQFKRR